MHIFHIVYLSSSLQSPADQHRRQKTVSYMLSENVSHIIGSENRAERELAQLLVHDQRGHLVAVASPKLSSLPAF